MKKMNSVLLTVIFYLLTAGYAKSPLSPAKKYYSFKVLKRKGQWVKVKDEWGNTGWIHRNFLWIR